MASSVVVVGDMSSIWSEEELNALTDEMKSKWENYHKDQTAVIEELKQQHEKLRVSSEQQCFELEQQLMGSQSRLETETSWSKQLMEKSSDLEKQNADLSNELQELQNSHCDCSNKQNRLQHAIEQLQVEKKDLLFLLDKRDLEINRISEDLVKKSAETAEAVRAKCEAITKTDDLASQELTLQFREQRLEQERALLSKQMEWLNAELKDRTNDLSKLRRECSKQVLDLQMQLAEQTEELRLLQSKAENATVAIQEGTLKNEEMARKLKESRDCQIKVEEHLQQQLRSQSKLTDLYKNAAEDSEKRTAELSTAVEELQKIIHEAGEEFDKREKVLLDEQHSLRQDMNRMQRQLESKDKELVHANKLLSAFRPKGLTTENIECLSPSAATVSNLLQSGKTLTQIYSEYMVATEQLQLEKYENQKLRQYMQQITQEIEDKAPQMMRQREDYELLLDTNAKLTQQLESAISEHEQMLNHSEEARRQAERIGRENQRLQRSNKDLGLQVRMLVKEIEELRGGKVMLSTSMEEDVEVSSTSCQVITDKLVTFKNIEELQLLNQQQLAVIRDLSDKQEQAETEATAKKTEELRQALQMINLELNEMRAAKTKQTELLESVIRQKDMYRVLLDQTESNLPLTSTPVQNKHAGKLHEAPDSSIKVKETQSALQQLQEEFTQYRREKMENDKFQVEEMEKLRNELSEGRLLNSKLAARLEHTTERFKILQTNSEGFKKEVTALTAKNQRLSANLMKQEQVADDLRHDLLAAQEKLARTEVVCENVRAERDLLKSVETRLLQEKEHLRKEQNGQAMVMANLQAIQNNLERAECETKIRLTNQNETLEKEIGLLRKKLDSEVDNYKAAVKAWEKEMQVLRNRVDAEVQKQQTSRDELVDAYAEVHRQKQELAEITAKLAAAEGRLKFLGSKSSSSIDSKKLENEEVGNKEIQLKELQLQFAEANMEIKSLKDQLQQGRVHLEQFKSIANSLEEQHRNEIETSKQYKETMESQLKENVKVQAQLEEKLQALEKEKQVLLQENQKLSSDSLNQNSSLRRELAAVQMDLQMALQRSNEAVKMENDAKRDCQAQVQLAREAQDKYERELMLHAADVQALSTLKEQIQETEDKLSAAKEKALAAEQELVEGKKSIDEKERVLKSERQSMSDQCKQLEMQNEHLHDQLERMSLQMLALQNRGSEESLNITISDDANKSSEQLLEVIRFLRREKEIALAKSEVHASENQCLTARITILEKQVEELQKSLTEEMQKSDVAMVTASQHMELIGKVGMLHSLTEANKLLQQEKETVQQNLNEISAKFQQLEKEISPLQEKNRDLQSERDSLTADTQVLKSEVKRWQLRTNQLVDQSNRANPEELKRAMLEKDSMQKVISQLNEDCQRLRAEISRMNVQLTTIQIELATVKANAQKKEKELERMTEELGAKDALLAEQNRTIQQVKKIGRKYKTQFDELKLQYDELKTKAESGSAAAAGSASDNIEPHAHDSSQAVAAENRLKETEEKITSLTDQLKKLTEELSALKKVEEQLKADANMKEERAKKVLHTARGKITQLTNIRDNLTRELEEIKKKTVATEQAHEEKGLLLSSLKSQYEGRIGRTERELKELQEWKANHQGILQEKERLQQEVDELKTKVVQLRKQLESQPKQFVQHSAPKIIATGVFTVPALAPSTVSESPPTANIKPLATPSSTPSHRLPHPHAMASSSSSSGTRSTPTASIRPMAIPQARKVAIVATTTLPLTEAAHDVPQATVTPTPSIPITSALSTSGATEPSLTCSTPAAVVTSVDESSAEIEIRPDDAETPAVVIANTTVTLSPRMESLSSSGQTPTEAPLVLSKESSAAAKRPREETEGEKSDVSPDGCSQEKRGRIATTETAPEKPAILEDAALAISDEVIHETKNQALDLHVSAPKADKEAGQSEVTVGAIALQPVFSRSASVEDDEVIVVESDDDVQEDEFITSEVHEGFEQDTAADDEDDDEGMEGDYGPESQFETDEHMHEVEYADEGTEIMDEEQFEDVAEEMADDDVVEIIDDEEVNDDDHQMESQDDGSSQTERLPSLQEEEPATHGSGGTSLPGTSRTQFVPRLPIRSERLPSLGRQQLTPFMSLGGGNFDEGDDSIVPSTPTLFIPRRNDGFAEAVSSPQVPQGRFVFGSSQEMVVPTSSQAAISQLASQGGVDDTRMDLSQFDEGSGRSVPTTPLQVSPPAETISNEMLSELPPDAQAASPAAVLVPDVGNSSDVPSITVTLEGDDNALPVQELPVESNPTIDVSDEPTIEEPETVMDNPEASTSKGLTIEEISTSEAESKLDLAHNVQPIVTEEESQKKSENQQAGPSTGSPSGSGQRRPTPIIWGEGTNRQPPSDMVPVSSLRGRGRRIRILGAQGQMRTPHRGGMRSYRGGGVHMRRLPRRGRPF